MSEIIINEPKLGTASFVVEINGTPCRVYIDGHKHVKFYAADFRSVNFHGFKNCRPTLDLLEAILINVFDPMVFSMEKQRPKQ